MTYLRFGIRDLLWAMVVVGMAVGWWLDRSSARYELTELQKEFNQAFESFALTLKSLQTENRQLRKQAGLNDDPFAD